MVEGCADATSILSGTERSGVQSKDASRNQNPFRFFDSRT